jgi:hypothetical protein
LSAAPALRSASRGAPESVPRLIGGAARSAAAGWTGWTGWAGWAGWTGCQMKLAGKTQYKDRQFTRRDLSTGQRKRLAMILALLEDRPLIVLDEWPADQDPEFRRYFYEVLIPEVARPAARSCSPSATTTATSAAPTASLELEYGRVRAAQAPAAHRPDSTA